MSRLKLHLILVLVACFGVLNIKAQTDTVYKFTLQQAQEFALANYFQSKNAKLDIEIAKKKVWETTAIGLPQVTGNFDYQHIPNPPTTQFPGPDGTPMDIKLALENSATYGATVSQLVFSGEYIVGLQASKTYKLFAQENLEKVQVDLKETIAGTYFTVLILKQNEEIVSQTLENLKLNLNHIQRFFDQGLVEETDVDQLNLVFKRTENSLLTIKRQLENMKKLMKIQMGISADQHLELIDDLDHLIATNLVKTDNYVFNLDENIDYRLLKTNVDLQALSLKREKSTYLPTINAFYKYSDKTQKADFDFNIKHVMGVSVSVPIFSSGMKMTKVSQAKMELEKTQNMKEQQAEMLVLAAQQALFDYNSAFENYNNEKMNFDLSKKVFDNTTIRFKEGLVSALDLSTINNQFLQAQLSFATAVQNLLTKKVALDKAYNKL